MEKMKFAAGLTVTGVIGLLLMEALKMVMVPVTGWLVGVMIVALKIFLVMIVLGIVVGLGVFFYKRQQKMAEEF
jgi:Flp pilus assembly protein TadB